MTQNFKMKLLLVVFGLLFFGQTHAQRNYYLSEDGKDKGQGTIEAPWKSLSKISAVKLQPGDSVLFNRGDRFDGHFVVKGSGSTLSPIVISAYGEGERPIITGEVGEKEGGDYEEAILIKNESNIVFDNLDIRNERKHPRKGVKDDDAYGIQVINTAGGIMENFTFQNMTFRDVFAVKPILDKNSFDNIQVSGLRFLAGKNRDKNNIKQIRNIEVKHSYFTNLQRLGIQLRHGRGIDGVGDDKVNRIQNVHIHHNEFSYNGGSAVLPNGTYNCLIEYNIFDHPGASTDPRMPGRGSSVWNIWSINTVVQYNYCLGIRGYLDSHGIHIDNYNDNTFVQYNYMEDCEGGFVEILRGNNVPVYRFNVSLNDGFRITKEGKFVSNHTIWVNAVRHKPESFALTDSTFVHNNTALINKPFKDQALTSISMDGSNTYVYNNVFSSVDGGATVGGHVTIKKVKGTSYTVTNNFFEGNIGEEFIAEDKNAIEGHLDANGAPSGIGANIKTPIIPGAGKGIFKNLPPYPTVDVYGNALKDGESASFIGAFGYDLEELKSVSNGWVIYPQLANGTIKFISNSNVDMANLQISTLGGEEIFNKNIALTSGVADVKVSDIKNGLYRISLKTGDVNHERTVILYN